MMLTLEARIRQWQKENIRTRTSRRIFDEIDEAQGGVSLSSFCGKVEEEERHLSKLFALLLQLLNRGRGN